MSIISKRSTLTSQSERGIISIMTAMVLMIVISLIVLGFAQISRRNQRETLDRQLSAQAFYAAETAINDAQKIINEAVAAGNTVATKSECGGSGSGGFYASLNPDLDSSIGVKYACLLVDPQPKSLQYSNIGTTSTIVPLVSADSSAIGNITLQWKSKSTSATPLLSCPTTTDVVFTPSATWNCGYGVLRFDLVPTEGSLSVDALQSNVKTIFAVPLSAGAPTSNISFPGSDATSKIGAQCTNNGCELQISGLTARSYHMRISSIYKDASLKITAKGNSGNELRIVGAQAIIDATGRAQDVLRRIQVRVPLNYSSKNELSDYAIESNLSLCKRFSVATGYISNNVGGASGGRLCQSF